MKNIPDIKLGIVVGSTDWLPSEIAIENRKSLLRLIRRNLEKRVSTNAVSVSRIMK